MLTPYLPIALAVAGTLLMAVVIFAPVPVPATVTVSFAPPGSPPRELPFAETWPDAWSDRSSSAVAAPRWPVLLDPSAADCDVAARLALVEALRAVRAPWADEILRRALDDEHDDTVREALSSFV